MLIRKNGREEVVWANTLEDDPDGSFFVNDAGILERFKETEPSEDDEYRELAYPELEQKNLLIRRNFYATPKVKNSDQRENIFQAKCKIKDKVCELIIDRDSESNYVRKTKSRA